MLFHQTDSSCKSKIKEVLIPILMEPQKLFFSNQKYDHLKQSFADNFQDNFSAEKLIHHNTLSL